MASDSRPEQHADQAADQRPDDQRTKQAVSQERHVYRGKMAPGTSPVTIEPEGLPRATWIGEQGVAVFYRLTRKFVDTQDTVTDKARDILYYSLAVGHHTGMIDCLDPTLACPLKVYQAVVDGLPEGDARHKLEGLLTFGEIIVEDADAMVLLPQLEALLEQLGFNGSRKASLDVVDPNFGLHVQMIDWLIRLKDLLTQVRDEPALYLIGRGR